MSSELTGTEKAQVLRKVAWRVNTGVYLTRCVTPVTTVLVVFGVCFLLARMLAPHWAIYTYGVFAALPVALVWVYLYCRNKGLFFNEQEVVEVVDHLSASDGLATTVYERPTLGGGLSAWKGVLANLTTGPLSLDARWFSWRLAPACLFAGAVFLVPPRMPKPPVQDMTMTMTQTLQERMEIVAEVLPEPEREKLREQLEQIEAAPEGVSKEKWEAVEEMEQRLENAMAQSEAAAYQLSSSMNQLASMVSQAEVKAPNSNDPELQSDIEAVARQISDQMQKNSFKMSEDLKKKIEKAMGECKGGGMCKSKELSDLLKECQGLSQELSDKQGQCYGRGGVDRGRGDAPMVFGNERFLENPAFDAQQLKNEYFNANDLVDMGITPMQPTANPGMFKPGTVTDFGSQQGTNVSRTEISPSQRGVVSRYFE